MSLLVVGLSHRSAPVGVLERAALSGEALTKLLHDVMGSPSVAECVVLSTCNRVEVYADVEKFHIGVAELGSLLALHAGLTLDELSPSLYVHYEGRAVYHLYAVASGLDSMVVGESQVLGQLKSALALARKHNTTGRLLDGLVQQALRVGKRVHTETVIDRAGQSMVTVALEQAEGVLGDLDGLHALVIGAGSMSALVATTLRRVGLGRIVIANRTAGRAQRLAASVEGEAAPFDAIPSLLADADLVVSCTGAAGLVVTADAVSAVTEHRSARPLVVLDLALPRDVDPALREIPGVALVDLEWLSQVLAGAEVTEGVEQAREIVTEEVAAFAAAQRAERVAPTVVALRSWAAEVVDAELARLTGRVPGLADHQLKEITQTVRRVVDKLLHAPTVRVKQLAAEPDGGSYAEALRKLFDLDIKTVEAVSGTGAGDESGAADVSAIAGVAELADTAPSAPTAVDAAVTEAAVTEAAVTEAAVTEAAVTEAAVTDAAATEAAATEAAADADGMVPGQRGGQATGSVIEQ